MATEQLVRAAEAAELFERGIFKIVLLNHQAAGNVVLDRDQPVHLLVGKLAARCSSLLLENCRGAFCGAGLNGINLSLDHWTASSCFSCLR